MPYSQGKGGCEISMVYLEEGGGGDALRLQIDHYISVVLGLQLRLGFGLGPLTALIHSRARTKMLSKICT